MPISALRAQLERGLLAFAWNEWSQLGLLTTADRKSVWAQDPEALARAMIQRVDRFGPAG